MINTLSHAIAGVTKLSDAVNRFVKVVTIITTLFFLAIVFAGVVSRYILNVSLISSVELSKLLFVWSAFLAATIAYKQKGHIRFEFLNNLFGKKGIAITDVLLYICSSIFFVIVFIYSLSFTRMIWGTTLPVMNLSQGWLYVAVVVSSIIFFIHTLSLFTKSLHDMHDAWSRFEGEKR